MDDKNMKSEKSGNQPYHCPKMKDASRKAQKVIFA
jgi:hypothetical protein